MRVWTVMGSIAGVALLGGVVYGWGVGWLFPCGPVDRIIQLSQCRVLASFDATLLETLLLDSDGDLVTVMRQEGPEPTGLQRLIEIAATTGAIASEIDLPGVPPGASWMNASLSPDGNLIGAIMLNEPAMVVDRTTGEVVVDLPLYSVAAIGFDSFDHVMVDQGVMSSEHPPEPIAKVFALVDATPLPDATGSAALSLFQSGIAAALSPDGEWLAQHVETLGDSGIVAIRLADAAFVSWSGYLLTAPLGAWRQQILPRVWFSPDSAFVAAAFDSAPVWGKDTSALMIWDVGSKELLQRIPTHSAQWDQLVWLDEREVAVTRFNTVTRRGEIAVIDY
jgi:hypothetical protein